MSKDYTFTGDLAAVIGNATKKSDYDKLAANTDEINQRLQAVMFLGGFMPLAGSLSITYDGNGRVSTVTFATSPVGTVTVSYDDDNGGRVAYVEMALTDPVVATIRETYSYDGSNIIKGSTRTVS